MNHVAIDTSPATGWNSQGGNALGAWLPSLIALAVACGVFGCAFETQIAAAVRVWVDSTAYNHCFLVLPLVAVLLWKRRTVVTSADPRPMPGGLLLLLALALLWVAVALVDVLEAEQLLAVALFEVLLLTILGWRVFRALLAPLLFLFFLVPFGAFLVPSLQQFTAAFATNGLKLVGIPVFADGLVIQIPEGNFEVAAACAGLRFLIASVVFGCFFATIVYASKWTRLLFVFLSIVFPIIANGIRVFGLIFFAHVAGDAAAVEADHVLYGWLFFTIVTLLLIAIGLILPNRADQTALSAPAISRSHRRQSGLRVGVVSCTALAIVAVGPIWLRMSEPASAAASQTRLPDLAPGDGWVRASDDPAGWRPLLQGADEIFPRTYRDGDMTAIAYILGYRVGSGKPISRMFNAIVDPEIWQIRDTGRVIVPIDGQTVAVNSAIAVRPGFSRSVWWFYVIDGQSTASSLEARFLHARAALFSGQHKETFVAIAAARTNSAQENATLRRFLSSFRPQ